METSVCYVYIILIDKKNFGQVTLIKVRVSYNFSYNFLCPEFECK